MGPIDIKIERWTVLACLLVVVVVKLMVQLQ
jgi:hypothetical protein